MTPLQCHFLAPSGLPEAKVLFSFTLSPVLLVACDGALMRVGTWGTFLRQLRADAVGTRMSFCSRVHHGLAPVLVLVSGPQVCS